MSRGRDCRRQCKKRKVPSDPIPSLAHHGHATVLSIAFQRAVHIACLLPGNRCGGYRFNAFRRAAAYLPKLNRSLVTAFPSPATAPAFADSIPGSKVPACYFAISLAGFDARSTIRLHCRNWFAPIPAASTLQVRCTSARKLIRPLSSPPLPSGNFRSLGIKAFNERRCRPVRLPNPPDLRSLPAAGSITRLSCGSSSAVRYVSGGLLFLKPLGTTINMLLRRHARQRISGMAPYFSTGYYYCVSN
jgi:hypothetical protein